KRAQEPAITHGHSRQHLLPVRLTGGTVECTGIRNRCPVTIPIYVCGKESPRFRAHRTTLLVFCITSDRAVPAHPVRIVGKRRHQLGERNYRSLIITAVKLVKKRVASGAGPEEP